MTQYAKGVQNVMKAFPLWSDRFVRPFAKYFIYNWIIITYFIEESSHWVCIYS